VLKWDQTVEIRNVAVGATQGDTSAITAGLDPGELVVVNGAHRLRRGSRVNVQLATDSLALGAVIRPMALLEGPPSKSFAKANAKIP
jgi:multidrug efflux system membrane fusion protein